LAAVVARGAHTEQMPSWGLHRGLAPERSRGVLVRSEHGGGGGRVGGLLRHPRRNDNRNCNFRAPNGGRRPAGISDLGKKPRKASAAIRSTGEAGRNGGPCTRRRRKHKVV